MGFLRIATQAVFLIFGVLKSARGTFKALHESQAENLEDWAKYWVAYAGFLLLETVCDILLGWMSFYDEVKLVVVLWVTVSAPQSSVWLFDVIMNPLLNQHLPHFDQFLLHSKYNVMRDLMRLLNEIFSYATNGIFQLTSRYLISSGQAKKEREEQPQGNGLAAEEIAEDADSTKDDQLHEHEVIDYLKEINQQERPHSQSPNSFTKRYNPHLSNKMPIHRPARRPQRDSFMFDADTLINETNAILGESYPQQHLPKEYPTNPDNQPHRIHRY